MKKYITAALLVASTTAMAQSYSDLDRKTIPYCAAIYGAFGVVASDPQAKSNLEGALVTLNQLNGRLNTGVSVNQLMTPMIKTFQKEAIQGNKPEQQRLAQFESANCRK